MLTAKRYGDALNRMTEVEIKEAVVVLTGPPSRPNRDSEVVRKFVETDSVRIVCGGTTSRIVSNQTGGSVEVDLATATAEIPPLARMDGLALVTEGIVTLTKARDLLESGACADLLEYENDAASRLVTLLLKAAAVRFVVGGASNPAHREAEAGIECEARQVVVKEIATLLEGRGVTVCIEMV